MVHKSILVRNSLEETELILKEIIPLINGKIKYISDDEYVIRWTYLYDLKTISCETILVPYNKNIEISSTSNAKGKHKIGAEKAIESLYTELSQTKTINLVKTRTKKEHTQNEKKYTEKEYKVITLPPPPIAKMDTMEKEKQVKYWILLGIFIATIFLVSEVWVKPSPKTGNELVTTKPGYFASHGEYSIIEAYYYEIDGDYESLFQMEREGRLMDLPAYREAYIIKQVESIGRGKTLIRLKGTSQEVWVLSEALEY